MLKATYRRRVYLGYDFRGVGRDGQRTGAEGGRHDSYCCKLKSESSHLKPEAGSKQSKLEMNQGINCQSLLPAHIEVMGSYRVTIPKSPQWGGNYWKGAWNKGCIFLKVPQEYMSWDHPFTLKQKRCYFQRHFSFSGQRLPAHNLVCLCPQSSNYL